MVKIWSAVPLPDSTGGLDELAASLHQPRVRFQNAGIMSRFLNSDPHSENSTEEDLDMLVFMDLMIAMCNDSDSDNEESDGDSSNGTSSNHSPSEDANQELMDLLDAIVSDIDSGDSDVSFSSSQNEDEDLEISDGDSYVEPAVD